MTGSDKIDIQEHLEKVLAEKDRLCDAKMDWLAHYFEAAIRALETRYSETFQSLDKSINKAESAQREYNARSNEFRGQLDDQAKTLMPRAETQLLVRSLEDKIRALNDNHDARFNRMSDELVSLRDSRSQASGQGTGRQELWSYVVGMAALILSLCSIAAIVVKW